MHAPMLLAEQLMPHMGGAFSAADVAAGQNGSGLREPLQAGLLRSFAHETHGQAILPQTPIR
jgi:hypothetical protein